MGTTKQVSLVCKQCRARLDLKTYITKPGDQITAKWVCPNEDDGNHPDGTEVALATDDAD